MQYTNNKTRGSRNRSNDKPIEPEQLFTGAKTPEYAVFYNIAYWWVSDLLKDLYKKRKESTNDKDLETSPYIDRFLSEGKDLTKTTLPDLAYSKLRDYLWKGYSTNKNSSGYQLTVFDKRLIHKLISKLVDIRNFHSHVWHDNDCLTFDEELKKWVDDMHLLVIDKLSSVYPWETSKYVEEKENFFDRRNGKIFITQEGRNFFLSFFLQKSEMSRFLQQRKGCKRNDKPEFRIKHLVYSYFTHRDGATKKRYSVEKTAFSELEIDSKNEILNARQLYKLVSYLNDTPLEVIDTKLFPLFRNGELVENADQMCSFIQEQNLFSRCEFRVFPSAKEESQIHTLQLNLIGNSYTFQITQRNIHKLILDIIRGGIDEQHFYDKLEHYISNRVKFPIVLDEYLHGNGYLDEINEYYNQKLKVDDKVRKILGQIIDKYEKDGTPLTDKAKELLAELKEAPIELNYYDFYFQVGRKPRMEDRFMEFSVNYLIDKKVVPEWEWLVENLDPEEEKTGDSNSSASKSVIKRKNYFFSEIPEGCRLNLGNNHAVVRLKSKPDIIFGVGRNAMRNLMIVHLNKDKNRKPIAGLLDEIYTDLDLIRNAGKTATPLTFENLQLLESVSIPRYLKLMMHDPSTIDGETMDTAIEKAKDRIKLLINDFTNLLKGDVLLNRNAKNEQIIRCYKFFDWKYPNDSKFKFLRKNEYKQISIYHYCIKPDSRKNYLAELRKRLLADIEPHMPKEVNDLLNSSESFDELFQNTLIKAIDLLKEWQRRINHENKDLPQYLSKLGIHIPTEPVPAKSNASNLPLMNRIPFEIHPSSIFKAFNYGRETNPYLTIRGNAKYTKGLIAQHYSYNHYLKLCNDKKLQSKIIGEVNNFYTTDTLLWMMAQHYLEKFTTVLSGNISKIIKSKYVECFQVDHLHDLELPVYQSDKSVKKPYEVIVKFRQLDDYMLIAVNPLIKLVDLLFMRLTTDEQLCSAGITRKDGYYQIPYVLVKQELERVFHGSVIATNFIMQWEKTIVEGISENFKQQKIDEAKNSSGSWAYLSFDDVLDQTKLDHETKKELKKLRNHAMHTKIPEGWTYQGMLESSRIKNLLGITPETMKKYEKKGEYYAQKALEENRLTSSLV